MTSFKYNNCIPVKEWGCHFDSMLEFKYALSIQDDYEFLRSRIPVYYDPKTKKPTDYLRYNTKRYTPDFLIRHKISLQAFWIEIKPRAFEKEKQLQIRRFVAEEYIKWKGFDWKFKVVYDDEIFLSAGYQEIYNSYYRYMRKYPGGYDNKKDRMDLPMFRWGLDNSNVRFIMFGSGSQHNSDLAYKPDQSHQYHN
ncbi:MAG: TnsA endonuclease N-terminal domain-containing protein [Bacteroidota bacterium]